MAKRDRTQTLRWLNEDTQRRRENRGRRKRTLLMFIASMMLMLVLSLPSLLCFSPLIHTIVDSAIAPYGWKVKAERIRIGWITPLRLTGIDAVGPSGKTVVVAEMMDAPITVLDLLSGKTDLGTITIDALRFETEVFPGGSEIENDIQPFLEGPSGSEPYRATIVLRDAVAKFNQRNTDLAWRIDQLQANVLYDDPSVEIDAEGVITDPSGISGSVTAKTKLLNDFQDIELTLNSEGLPLSIFNLAAVRMPEIRESLPEKWSGNANGQFSAFISHEGEYRFQLDSLDLRNLVVQDANITGQNAWKVGHALATGFASFQGETLKFENLKIVSDAGELSLNGLVDLSALQAGQYLDAMLGDFGTEFDLGLLTQSAPGLIPVRNDVQIVSGRIKAEVRGDYGADQAFRSSWKLNTQPITAKISAGQQMVLEPVTADIVLKPSRNWGTAEKLFVKSSFGDASASGDLNGGNIRFSLDFQRLASTLRSILDLPPSSLGGIAQGNLQWSVSGDQIWRLTGNANTKDLVISLPGMTPIRRPALELKVDGEGLWGNRKLAQLNLVSLKVVEPEQQWNVNLTEPVVNPTSESLFPLAIKGRGDLQTLSLYANSFVPDTITYLDGTLEADLDCKVSSNRFVLSRADMALDKFSIVMDQQLYRQDTIKGHFDGTYLWPENILRAESLTVSGNAASFIAQGEYSPNAYSAEIAYRTDLQRLAQAMITPLPAPPAEGVNFAGEIEGRMQIASQANGSVKIDVNSSAKNLTALLPGDQGQPQVLWREPQVNAKADLLWAGGENALYVRKFTADLPWLQSALAGKIDVTEGGHNAALEGDADFDVEIVSDRLTTLLGEPIKLTGKHNTPLRMVFSKGSDTREVVDVAGSIGWNSAQVAGVTTGPAEIPLRVTADTIFVSPSSIPIEQGLVHLAGQVHYQAQPLWFEQQPGKFAEGIQLTPDMCRSWLKYMLPVAADTADVNGSFSLELAECKVIPSDPANSRVLGTLNIEGASIGPGPLTRNLIATINQLEAATKGLQGQPAPNDNQKQWMLLDPQAVDFSLVGGQVTHQRLQMRIDKASLISSGSVFLDGRLNLRLQLPLDSAWLGSDLKGLAGRQITLPVGGTLSRPVVDNQAVVSAITQVGALAIQSNAENFLQKQLDRQLQKLFKN